jgi:predicted phage terminase large subunit-like protein
MKTLLVSVMFPAWVWARRASARFLEASYGGHRTVDAASKVRRIVESEWYQAHYDVTLADDQNAKTRFNTDQGGWLIASSVGGVGTGEHPDYFIIDDPLTEAQSRSDVERSEANKWMDRTVSARGVGRGVKVIVVMQRLHEDDLTGHLLAKGGWEHICFPMRYEPSRPATEQDRGHVADARDPRRVAGALLWPEVFTEQKVKRLELDLGPYGTAGQLQQRPAPEGGGDYTAGVKIAEADGSFFVEDCVAEQVGPAGQEALMRQLATSDGKACVQREEKEGGASGAVVIAARLKMLKGYDYAGVIISADKVTRAKPFRAQCEGGNVYLVRGAWNEPYIRELCDFPTGAHDDRVDASSCAFNAVLLEPEPRENWVTW